MADYLMLANKLIDLRIKLIRGVYIEMLSKLMGSDIFILHYLENNTGPIHPKDLSNAMSVSTPRITSLLNKMEADGEIERQPDPRDKRQLIVVMTEKGRARSLQNRQELLPDTAGFLELLGPDDAAAYIRIQEKLWQLHTAKEQKKE